MTRIKICGITNISDARLAVELGADALGFVFAASPRRITPPEANRIIRELPAAVSTVGVFVNEEREIVQQICTYCRLDVAQLHGDENLAYIQTLVTPALKVFRVKNNRVPGQIRKFRLPCFLLDTYNRRIRGGTGKTFNWEVAREATQLGKVVLSGGLNALNIATALATARPYAVDVSSGVEDQPGKKDHTKLKQFCSEVHQWDSQIDSATSVNTAADLFLKH